jgi:hypothetical protein
MEYFNKGEAEKEQRRQQGIPKSLEANKKNLHLFSNKKMPFALGLSRRIHLNTKIGKKWPIILLASLECPLLVCLISIH